MNIGIITVRDSDYHPNRRLAEAAAQHGHKTILLHPYRLWPVLVENKPGVSGQTDVETLDVVLPRQGATIGDSCLAFIRHISLMGIPLVNDLDSILLARNQFQTLQVLAASRILVPDTLFVNSPEGFKPAIARLKGYPVVLKQVSGRQGKGVILVDNELHLDSAINDYLDKRKGLLVQRFIPPAGRKDIRVLVVGGKIVGAMELKPKRGDFRANYHLNQIGRSKIMSAKLEQLALKAASQLGLEIAGIDFIVTQEGKVLVIEVNYSPGFKGMEATTGFDIAAKIIKYVVASYKKK
jgi:ribosomal protein S6--L-glutamate ligase